MKTNGFLAPRFVGWLQRFALAPNDLLRDPRYRRLWSSILISNFGAQVTVLALPLTAAVLLNATPTQMGLLTAIESVPFVLFSLPTGVWLDRIRKLPVYVGGELIVALAVTSVPVAWWLDRLAIGWLYLVAFAIGTVNTVAGSAAQIVLTELVPRERLVEAHARNALASSMADVAGPGGAGALIKLVGAPLALLADGVLLVGSAAILRGIRAPSSGDPSPDPFWPAMRAGIRFVAGNRMLLTMALVVGIWHMCFFSALAVQILFATRELGLSERAIGLCYVALGFGTILSSWLVHRISRRLGPGPTLLLGVGICGAGWTMASVAPSDAVGVAAFSTMLFLFGVGAVFVFVNFLALRQAATPELLLGRMTATMRWLILIPAGPGALIGGWLGEQFGLRTALAFSGTTTLALALLAWRWTLLPRIRALPRPATLATQL